MTIETAKTTPKFAKALKAPIDSGVKIGPTNFPAIAPFLVAAMPEDAHHHGRKDRRNGKEKAPLTLFLDLVSTALTDPFRIALIVGLVITQARTAAQTGIVLPLVMGVIFVAVIIPSTMGYDPAVGLPLIATAGAVANVILLLPVLVARHFWNRRQG